MIPSAGGQVTAAHDGDYDMARLKMRIHCGAILLAFAAIFPAFPLAAQETVQMTYQGLRLNAVLSETDSRDAPVFLLLHGTLAHHDMEIMRSLREVLHEEGIASLAVTLSLGVDDRSGMYDCNAEHRHRHTDAIGELEAWRKWLVERGYPRQVLLGHSRGGNQVAWYLTQQHPQSVVAAVLVAPQLWQRDKAAAAYAERFGVPLQAQLDRAEQLRKSAGDDALLRDSGFVYCEGATVSAAALLSYHAPDERMHTPSLVAAIEPPVLVIAASEDQTVPGVAAAMGEGGDASVVEIEGADHFFRDLYVYDMVEAIVEFLDANDLW
jgi:pimeloyl-ACP methyl ester carboxylesterase